MKRLFLLMLMLSGIIGGAYAQAQPNWTAWLYNREDGSILQVNAAGEIVGVLGLPITQAFNAYGDEVLVSPSGRYIIYTAFDTTVETPNHQMFVYDSETESLIFTYDLTDAVAVSFGVAPKEAAFDESPSQVAIGILREGSWEILAIDIVTREVLATLNSETATIDTPPNMLPVVQRYDNGVVAFTAVPIGTEAQVSYPAFAWDVATGDITPDTVFTAVEAALTSAGDVAIPAFSADYPATTAPEGAVRLANLIEVVSQGERFAFYNSDSATIEQVYFIQNGARVLAKTYDFESDDYALTVINPNGTVSAGLLGTLDMIHGTPNGFIGLFPAGDGVSLAFVDTTGEGLNPVTVWTGANVQLVHVASDVPGVNIPLNWTRLERE